MYHIVYIPITSSSARFRSFLSAALRSNAADYVLPLFIYLFLFFIFLFTVRSQKLLDRFLPNFQESCILV